MGASFLFMRIAVPEFGPVPLIFVRVAIAAVLLLGLLVWRGGAGDLRSNAGALVLLGGMNTAVPFSLFAFTKLTLSAGLTSVLNATVPLFAALVSVVWLRERLAAMRVAGLLTGFGGVLVLAWPNLTAGGDRIAVLAALGATILYALSAHFTRRRFSGTPPLVVATGSLVAAAALTLPFAVALWPSAAPSAVAWACAVTLGVFCTAVAYALFFRLIAQIGAVTVLAVTYLIPVFGVTWGAIVLGERLSASAFIGAALVLAGVALTTKAPSPRPAPG